MDLTFSPAAERFRTELKKWLRENAPAGAEGGDALEFATLDEEFAYLRAWQARLAEARWVGVHWPVEYGGRGVGPEENYILQEEMAQARAPRDLKCLKRAAIACRRSRASDAALPVAFSSRWRTSGLAR